MTINKITAVLRCEVKILYNTATFVKHLNILLKEIYLVEKNYFKNLRFLEIAIVINFELV